MAESDVLDAVETDIANLTIEIQLLEQIQTANFLTRVRLIDEKLRSLGRSPWNIPVANYYRQLKGVAKIDMPRFTAARIRELKERRYQREDDREDC